MNNINYRSNNLKRNDNVKDLTFSIKEVDETILNYIKNVINPTVVENNVQRSVPVYYANPQIWVAIQKYGFMRDPKTQQILVPAIVIKNVGVSKDESIPIDKLDGNLTKIIYKKYINDYDVINKKENLNVEYYSVMIPEYVVINYTVQIWTAYINHMNPIIEKFMYYKNGYWGEGKNRFRTLYNEIQTNIEVNDGQNSRLITSTINMNVHAYILPDRFKNMPTNIKRLSTSKIIFKTETVLDENDIKLNNK